MRRAFSLLEVVVAAGIVALVVVAVLNIFPGSFLALHRADQRSQAGSVAQSILEERRAADPATLVPATTNLPKVTMDGIDYQPRLKVYYVGGDSKLKGLEVTVTWLEHGFKHSLTRELQICPLKNNN